MPKTEGFVRIEIKDNEYLKMYRMKNNMHEGDWENCRSLASNLDFDSISKLGKMYPFNWDAKREPDLELGIKGLYKLG